MVSLQEYPWQEACLAAQGEADSRQLMCQFDHAISALERRFAEWNDSPGSEAESQAIRQAIVALRTLLERQLRKSA